MNNNIYLYILSIFIFSSSLTFSQNLYVQNPSFEGPSGPGIVPAPWTIHVCLDNLQILNQLGGE